THRCRAGTAQQHSTTHANTPPVGWYNIICSTACLNEGNNRGNDHQCGHQEWKKSWAGAIQCAQIIMLPGDPANHTGHEQTGYPGHIQARLAERCSTWEDPIEVVSVGMT